MQYCNTISNRTSRQISWNIMKNIQRNENLQLVFIDNIKYIGDLLVFKELSVAMLNELKDIFDRPPTKDIFNYICSFVNQVVNDTTGNYLYTYLIYIKEYINGNIKQFVYNVFRSYKKMLSREGKPPRSSSYSNGIRQNNIDYLI